MKSLLLALALWPQVSSQRTGLPAHQPAQVEATLKEGRTWYSVRATNASARTLLTELGRLSEREVAGLERLDRGALVTAQLNERPLEQVLEYTLGSLGLSFSVGRDEIEVLGNGPVDTAEWLDLASAAWIRASTRFPDHPSAARARLFQGELAERRDMSSIARDHYLALIEDYPNAEVVGEAYMRAGRLSAQRGQWREASRLFRDVAELPQASDYHAAARLEWARTLIAQGDPKAALYMLEALDTNFAASDPTEITARRLVRARAYNALELYMDALEEIDQADPDFDRLGAWEALAIRAESLAGIGMPGEAARAWLLYAMESRDHEQAFAFEAAARMALDAGDELSVLFIVRQAAEAGLTTGLEPFEQEARERLGLEPLASGEEGSFEERVTHIEQWIDEGDFARARERLESLYVAYGALEQPLAARVCAAWARCVEDAEGLAPAIAVLEEARPTLVELENRRLLDLTAARLFEGHGRFTEAIEAYQGRYVQP